MSPEAVEHLITVGAVIIAVITIGRLINWKVDNDFEKLAAEQKQEKQETKEAAKKVGDGEWNPYAFKSTAELLMESMQDKSATWAIKQELAKNKKKKKKKASPKKDKKLGEPGDGSRWEEL